MRLTEGLRGCSGIRAHPEAERRTVRYGRGPETHAAIGRGGIRGACGALQATAAPTMNVDMRTETPRRCATVARIWRRSATAAGSCATPRPGTLSD
jgi:hypothetical protein